MVNDAHVDDDDYDGNEDDDDDDDDDNVHTLHLDGNEGHPYYFLLMPSSNRTL